MIFYFSGTGNTRWAAQHLAEATGERLVNMAEAMRGETENYTLDDGERLGFCFPVHGWQPPHIVRTFLAGMQIAAKSGSLADHYCYALCTCGDSIGQAMDMFAADLQSHQQLSLHAAFTLVMPESYVCLPFMYTDTLERERQKIDTARQQLDDYTAMICNRTCDEEHLVRGVAPWLMSHVVGAYFNARMVNDKKFTVDADRCTHCGRCRQVCPTANISSGNGLPQWQHNGSCTSCLACYHHCAQHAINYGSITRKRGQYYFGKNK